MKPKPFKSNLGRFDWLKAALLCSALTWPGLAWAQGIGDLLVAPTRVVFEGETSSAEINLTNIGTNPSTYRISLIHQRMSDDGKLEEIKVPDPDEKFADELVRFTPSRIVLEPKTSQVVRIQLHLPAGLDTGEYRSHLLFRAVPAPGTETASVSSTSSGLSINVRPHFGVSIPLIVRHGVVTAKVSMEGLKLHSAPDGSIFLTGRLNRSGNGSAFGEILVEYKDKDGVTRPLALSKGVAVYSPNTSRNFALRLTGPEGHHLSGGTLHVTYRQPAADGHALIAESRLAAN